MQITKQDENKGEVILTIEITNEEAQPFLLKAASRISERVKVEGFRPGKAPYEIIKQRVGEMSIYQEAIDNLVGHFYVRAVKDEKLNVVAQPKIELEKFAPGNPIVFKATVGIMPEVKLADWKNIKIEKKEIKVEDAEVEKTIDDLRKYQVKEALVDRPAKKGDKVEVDFEVMLDKVVIEGGKGNKYPLILGEGQMIPGFEEQIEGMKKAEEKTFQLKFPDSYQNKMTAGKLCDFKVKLLAVYNRELPEVTDDFAKSLGAKDVKDLKSKINDNLKTEKEYTEAQRVEIEILNEVVKKTEFGPIPETLIHNETHRMVHEFRDSIEAQGLQFADYLTSIQKDEKQLEDEFKSKAEERVKTSIVVKEISDQEKIQASDKEIDDEVAKIMLQVSGNPEAEENIKSEGYRQYLVTVVRNRKVIEMMKKECVK